MDKAKRGLDHRWGSCLLPGGEFRFHVPSASTLLVMTLFNHIRSFHVWFSFLLQVCAVTTNVDMALSGGESAYVSLSSTLVGSFTVLMLVVPNPWRTSFPLLRTGSHQGFRLPQFSPRCSYRQGRGSSAFHTLYGRQRNVLHPDDSLDSATMQAHGIV